MEDIPMNKSIKVGACVAGGALLAIGSLVLADRYLGKNYLGSPTGKIVGRCFKNGKYYLYVRRFNRINEVEVDAATCLAVKNGDYFDMASEGSKLETRRRAQPEEVLNHIPTAEELADMAEEPVCECVGACTCENEDSACTCNGEGECECGENCTCKQ
jgi:hypothetical protein